MGLGKLWRGLRAALHKGGMGAVPMGRRRGWVAVLMCVLVVAGASGAAGAAGPDPNPAPSGRIRLTAGTSATIPIPEKTLIGRIAVAAPEVADIPHYPEGTFPPERHVYITGKAPGLTTLTLWDDKDRIFKVYEIEVVPDVSRLQAVLKQLMPDEKGVKVTAVHDAVVLTGTVSGPARMSQILELAASYAPGNKVINLTQVSGVHQVMLEVRVAEMSTSLMRRLGFNFEYLRGTDFVISRIGSLINVDDQRITFSDSVSALFRFNKGNATWTGFIDALKEEGLVTILAEPNLIALSGQTADFLAGGEYPVPVPDDEGDITIEYKKYGVSLGFTPTVLQDDLISMRVSPEVSELDFGNALLLGGYVVPALTTRRATTVVELRSGESFAIAGLIKQNVREAVSRFPLLGDIPILGALFRSSSFQKQESELVIIVTPHLVKPMKSLARQPLPVDRFTEPSMTEFFLFGLLQGQKGPESAAVGRPRGLFDGPFGHVVP